MSTTSVILLSFFVCATVALVFPEHHCPEYFTYGMDKSGSYIGVFTANEAGVNNLNFLAIFKSKNIAQISKMEPYPSYDEAIVNINKGLRGQTFVRFINNGKTLPTLTKFYLNDKLLCNTTIKNAWRRHYVKTSFPLTTQEKIRKVENTRPKMHPILPVIKPRHYITN
ncbi:uncharacterized protein LOC119560184 [Drosophila subpulchrella]|uniref:uncharacterized protein LOC119560184 n=1 Tax=Drosophila subpulchrella TaxID=1486046 RepID=UPI0018A1799E|nr:uncharacterized protein LOC119560184 [Drosophila subpulchrella]